MDNVVNGGELNLKEINIAAVISTKRREKGLTQDELAEYMGVSKASVSKWETGQSYPDITFLPQLAAYFNITVDELIGYLPQMTQDEIKKNYNRLSKDFATKAFDEVYEDCQTLIKKYYSCFPLVLHMALLLINHVMLIKEPEKQTVILNEIISLCNHIKSNSEDVWLSKQANSIEAMCYLALQKPLEVLELLDGTIKPLLGDELLLSNAYMLKGNVNKAKSVLQISIYQYVMNLLSFAPLFMYMHMDNTKMVEEIFSKFIKVAEAFDVEELRADISANLYYMSALSHAQQQNAEKTIDMLKLYAKCCLSDHFAVPVVNNEFFNSIEEWFEEFGANKRIPRDMKVIREETIKVINDNPAFNFLKDDVGLKNIINSLSQKLKGGK